MSNHASPGFHVMLDLAGVPRSACTDDGNLVKTLASASERAGCTVINSVRYRFGHDSPDGCTAFVMLDESHVAVHTYADDGLMAVDVFVCGDRAREKAAGIVKELKLAVPHVECRETTLDRFVGEKESVAAG